MNGTVMSKPDLGRKQYKRCQVLKPVTGFRASFRVRGGEKVGQWSGGLVLLRGGVKPGHWIG